MSDPETVVQSEPKILTLEELVAHSETIVPLALLSAAIGEARAVRVRKIASREYLGLLPSLPPQSATWPKDDDGFQAAERAWLLTLPDEQLEPRKRRMNELDFHIVALAAVDPPMTFEQARRIGEDAADVAAAVKAFSGFRKPEDKKAKQGEAAAAAPPGDAA